MNRKILIVDDDRELVQEVTEILSDCGYQVSSAFDSAQAETLIERRDYDIYLLDYKIPGSCGIDLLKKIKHKHSQAAVFIISGMSFIEKILQDEGVNTFISGVIKKPFAAEVLLQNIAFFQGRD